MATREYRLAEFSQEARPNPCDHLSGGLNNLGARTPVLSGGGSPAIYS